MPLAVPNLDDRTWADLVDEARSLIPRLAPRWTDHNIHDPGITFLELFAWLAEMQMYQLNRVGERHREAFGRLAGVRRGLRRPARVDVQATGNLTAPVFLPEGTQLTPLEGDEIVFETTSNVTLTRSRLRRIVVDDGSGPIDQTEANEKSEITFLAFGERAGRGASLRLGFDAFYPAAEPELRLNLDLFTEDLITRCGPSVPVTDPEQTADETGVASVDLAWEYLGAGGQWSRLEVVADGTRALSRTGTVRLQVPTEPAADRNQVWIRARIVRGEYDIEPRLRRIALNMLPCVQHETVRDELLGQGNGRPDQWRQLSKGPLLIPSSGGAPVVIDVGGEAWEPVTSLEDSEPGSNHFVFDAESGRVLFGNGLNGRVPPTGQAIRARWYRTSNGRSGNVAKGLRWKFRTAAVPAVLLKNPDPASGGTDPEPLNEMELRARALLNRPNRAVTPLDIERLALGTPGAFVARAAAIPNCPTPEGITVVALSKVRPGRTGPPKPPSAAFLSAVEQHLQQRRLLCDNLRVVGPVYVEVRVSARLRLTKGAAAATVLERALRALGRFLAGEDEGDEAPAPLSPCPTRWPLGRWVFPSEVYAVLDGVTGVDVASNVVLSAWNGSVRIEPHTTGAIPIPRVGLVFAGRHALTVEPDARRAR
jgi:predicted phage baseplate assembly protein